MSLSWTYPSRGVARVDPTGVGDAYRAGFAGLAWEVSLERCAQLGSLLASYAIEVVGTQGIASATRSWLASRTRTAPAAAGSSAPVPSAALSLGRVIEWVARAEQPPYCSCRHCGRARSA